MTASRSHARSALAAGLLVLLVALVAACGPEAGSGGAEREEATPAAGGAGQERAELPAWCRGLPRPANDSLELALTSDDGWYRVYRVAPGVHALYEPHQFQEVVSYLVEGEERAVLVDTGMGIVPIRPVVARITDRPVTVLNTHSHPDHVGGNHAFRRVLAYDTAFAARRAREGYPNERMRDQVAPDALCRPLPPETVADDYRIRPWEISGHVEDGTRIELGGRTLEVLHVPGHTPDGLAILDREHGLLFTGDNLYRGPIYLFSEGADLEAYARSMSRLAELAPSVRTLLPGHNTAVAPPEMLGRVSEALERVRAGRALGRTREGRVEYVFEDFSFLLSRPDAGGP